MRNPTAATRTAAANAYRRANSLAPRTPARPAPRPLPLDPTYEQQTGAARRNYETTAAGLQYQRQRLGQSYGFTDTSDPYNRAAMLERNYHQAATGMQNAAAARGQLYSGATTSNLDEGRYQYERSRSGLRREFDDASQALTQRGAESTATYQNELGAAGADRVTRALESRPEDPGPPVRAPTRANPQLANLRAQLAALRRSAGGHWSAAETRRLHALKTAIARLR